MTRAPVDMAIGRLLDTLRAGLQHDSYTIGWLTSLMGSLVMDSRLKLTEEQKEALLHIIERDIKFAQKIMAERKAG
jgi:hypothetical protein